MPTRCASFAVVLLIGLSLWPSSLQAEVSPALQVKILLKIVSYDRNFDTRVGEDVRIGVLEGPTAASRLQAREIVGQLDALSNVRVSGKPMSALLITWQDKDHLTATMRENRINVLYVARDMTRLVPDIAAVAKDAGALTITSSSTYVRQGGVVAGVDIGGSKPKIVINLKAASRHKASFPSNVLKLAEVIR